MAPFSSNGSSFIYYRFIKPFVVKHQSEIDEALNEASAAATKAANTAMDQGMLDILNVCSAFTYPSQSIAFFWLIRMLNK